MADKATSNLTAASALDGTELVPIVQGGNSRKATVLKISEGSRGADIASATTTDIGAATGDFIDVTGTTTITGLGTIAAGVERTVRFTGALTLTHNATSLILPGAANILTVAGDVAQFRSLGSGNWRCVGFLQSNSLPLKGTAFPTSPVTDQIFYRTDRRIEYFYDGTRWLSTQLFTLHAPQDGSYTVTSANRFRTAIPWGSVYDIYILYISISYIFVGTGGWTTTFNANKGSTTTSVGTIVVATANSGDHYFAKTDINAVYSAYFDLDYTFTKNSGSATFYPMPAMTYRLIG